MKYWAKHILFFSVLLLVASVAIAADRPAYGRDDFREFTVPSKVLRQSMEGIDNSFQKVETGKGDYRQFYRKEKELQDIYEQYWGKLQRPEPQPVQAPMSCENPLEVEYYFSFSMPEASIMTAVADTLALRKDCVQVTMYLKGLIDNNLKKTITTFYNIAKANPEDLPIQIDPVRFKKEGIQVAPTTIIKGKRLTGDMRLVGIAYNIDAIREGKVAITYAVAEEDLAELFKKRAHLADQNMRDYIASGKAKEALKITRYDGHFSRVREQRTYYIDPTQTLEEDILDNNGAVLIRRGTTVNPLDQISMGRYIFIDGNDPKQVKEALTGNYRKIILMSGDSYELGKTHGKIFYHAADELVSLFRVERVPAIVEQEGKLVRVTEKRL